MADIRKQKYFLFVVLAAFNFALHNVCSERDATDNTVSPEGAASLMSRMSNIRTIQLTPAEPASDIVTGSANPHVEGGADVQPEEHSIQESQISGSSAPAADSTPFSDIYHTPGQQVINVDGLPQYSPVDASQPWSGPRRAPGHAGAAEADQPEFEGYNAAISHYSTHVTEAGVTYGDGTLDIYAKNGTVIYQTPFSAPLVPKAVLQRRLELMKIISSGQYTTVSVPPPAVYLQDSTKVTFTTMTHADTEA